MRLFFSKEQKYQKRARLWAILWTLLIFILCFMPGNELPDVRVPFVDKWAHFVMFGIFSFLWLSAIRPKPKHYLLVLLASVFVGWLVEYIQGHLHFLGRSQDHMDTLADSIGGLIGVIVYMALYGIYRRKREQNS